MLMGVFINSNGLMQPLQSCYKNIYKLPASYTLHIQNPNPTQVQLTETSNKVGTTCYTHLFIFLTKFWSENLPRSGIKG